MQGARSWSIGRFCDLGSDQLRRTTELTLAVARKSLFKLHNAVGLGVLVLVLISAVTGAVLSFRGQLGYVPPSAPVVADHLPLEQIIARAEAAGDGSPATDVQLALEPEDPYLVWLDDDAETEVYLDGAGEVLATREGRWGLTRILFQIHTGELLGLFGQALMVAAALGLCLLGWSGFGMWRSRRRPKARD
ncbi:hypothetical protein ENSA5_28050 [Enhygromyxa salina]|uniref:PepSY-associated TM helix n=1 Tax=Enhygromyxa salina TaxID=215803 RepID=A0A2S9Y4Q7_9BACT|nr:PepSY-associated TM helix domain-containing protein [Enhygromyxa salina]PRP99990.1 hypothetical protein ENSA5_28050 [Enhygromyxa salina]